MGRLIERKGGHKGLGWRSIMKEAISLKDTSLKGRSSNHTCISIHSELHLLILHWPMGNNIKLNSNIRGSNALKGPGQRKAIARYTVLRVMRSINLILRDILLQIEFSIYYDI